ncbi:hypothetical protein [Pseudomonas sp. PDM08]|uniref:hypothetical protein n=1 Tax=Pseudomonas sp. PDM08 TaxID=2769265 RepID=UPI00178696CE|nr:hypothetical protein [Pseudomonas sp. PDM08]MBD9609812.1 hypothetical protein [Pseudomonas sp. PDM08]
MQDYHKSEITKATKNIEAFINHSKNEIKLWGNIPGFCWDDSKWPTHHHPVRFCNILGINKSPHKPIFISDELSYPFIDFAKAYLRYTQHLRETKVFRRGMTAMRLLEHALIEDLGFANVAYVEPRHFTTASILIQTLNYQDTSGIGACLQKLAKDISALNLSAAETCNWKNPYVGVNSTHIKNKHLSQEKRQAKLPNDEGLLALAEIFSNGYSSEQDDEDIFISSATCLLLSAPMRISELGRFRNNVYKKEKDKFGTLQGHLNYWSPKTGEYVTKEIPTIISEHTEEAITRLSTMTEEGRKLAHHYETNGNKFYRHPECPDVGDEELLSSMQIAQALGFSKPSGASTFIYNITGNYSTKGWTLNKLWNDVILVKHKLLNPNFPYQLPAYTRNNGARVKMSDALICLRYRQISSHQRTSPVLLSPYSSSCYSLRVDGKIQKRITKNVSMSIFLKHGYPNTKIRSHEMRHFLNTLAQEAGISSEAITKWSTRASNAQTSTYMHMPSERKVEKISNMRGKNTQVNLPPITENDYDLRNKGPLISTRYGICLHPWTVTPCIKHADCLNCNELLICKGHKRSNEAIIKERNRVYENFIAAKKKIDNNEKAATRWFDAHKSNLERLDLLINSLDNNSIPSGTPIRIVGNSFTHENRILESTDAIAASSETKNPIHTGIDYHPDILACLKLLSEE